MPTLILTPLTRRGEEVVNRYGNEWLIIETRSYGFTVTDLDERHQMRVPNAHFDIEKEKS